MNTLNELVNELYNVNMKIKQIIKAAQYETYDDLSGLNYDSSNPDDAFLITELRGIMDKLETASCNIDYITRPIKGVYTLHKNRSGRYEWAASRVEHDGDDYYIVGYPDIKLDGLKIRLREV